MSSRNKGVKREQQAKNIYEAAGYIVHRAPSGRFSNVDYFDVFDLLALAPYSHLTGVQVKSNTASGIREWLEDVEPVVAIPGVHAEYVVPVDNEGWRLIRPKDDTYTTVYDERKDDAVGPHRDTPKNLGEGLTEFLAQGVGNDRTD